MKPSENSPCGVCEYADDIQIYTIGIISVISKYSIPIRGQDHRNTVKMLNAGSKFSDALISLHFCSVLEFCIFTGCSTLSHFYKGIFCLYGMVVSEIHPLCTGTGRYVRTTLTGIQCSYADLIFLWKLQYSQITSYGDPIFSFPIIFSFSCNEVAFFSPVR